MYFRVHKSQRPLLGCQMESLPDFKSDRLLKVIAEVLEKKELSARISEEHLARVVGSLVSAEMALGLVSRILLRTCHDLLACYTEDFTNMRVRFYLSDQSGRELQLLHQLISASEWSAYPAQPDRGYITRTAKLGTATA